MTEFSAAASALGTLHQLRGGLLLLLQHEDHELCLEGLDDVELRSPSGRTQLHQLKQRAAGTEIGDYDVDLWKTLRVWSSAVAAGSVDPSRTLFCLVTTAVARENSAAYLLRKSSARDPATALTLLTQAAGKSANKELTSAIAAFNALSQPQRSALVGNVHVCDGSMSILAVRTEIERELRLTVGVGQRTPMADRLEGWWFDLCVRHLAGNPPRLSGGELQAKVVDLARSFAPTSLPIDCGTSRPGPEESTLLRGRRFVHQLSVLGLSPHRIEYAVLDYYRAFTQRSRWAADQLLLGDQVAQYEDRLREEWDRVRLVLEDQLGGAAAASGGLTETGLELLRWMEAEDLRIREDVREKYVMRGSYHMLADRQPLVLWWHPEYPSRHAAGERPQ